MPEIQIMPSILAADFGHLAEAASGPKKRGRISFRPDVVKISAANVRVPQNVHRMVQCPQDHLKAFANAGSDTIQIHIESKCDIEEALAAIRALGKRPAITINPETPVESIFQCMEKRWVDGIL